MFRIFCALANQLTNTMRLIMITTFNCCIRNDTTGLTVFLGRQDQQGSNPNEVSRNISRILCHPDYNNSTMDNDICLLQLSSPVPFTDYIVPVCLAAKGSTFNSGVINWVTGWGTTSFEGGSSSGVPKIFSSVEASTSSVLWSRSIRTRLPFRGRCLGHGAQEVERIGC